MIRIEKQHMLLFVFRQLQNSTRIDQDASSKVSIDKGQVATWEDDKTELISNASGSAEMQVIASYIKVLSMINYFSHAAKKRV